MKNLSIKQKYIGIGLLSAAIFIVGFFVGPMYVFAEKDMTPEKQADQDEITDINNKIEEKTDVLNELKEKIKQYEDSIRVKQDEALDLQSQLDILEEDIEKNKTKIEQTKTEIEVLDYEIGETRLKILEKESQIDTKKIQLSGFLNKIYKNEQKTFLEILLANDTLSEYSSQLSYEEEIQKEFQKILDDVQQRKKELGIAKNELEQEKETQKNKKSELIAQRNSLKGEETYTSEMLSEIQNDEDKFQQLAQKMSSERQDIESEINTLEEQVKNKITDPEDNGDSSDYIDLDLFDPGWPLSGAITATFHDPTYPFKRWFEHDAVDIRAGQGTPVAAADSGYVAVARWDGSTSYSYILLVHADGYATLYGHMSAVYVEPEDYVSKGETIGLSGGMPGTPGAGSFTTGSHLHFGIRYNGIPVDPLQYLP